MFKLICLSTFKPICYVQYKEDVPLLDKCNLLYSNIKYTLKNKGNLLLYKS